MLIPNSYTTRPNWNLISFATKYNLFEWIMILRNIVHNIWNNWHSRGLAVCGTFIIFASCDKGLTALTLLSPLIISSFMALDSQRNTINYRSTSTNPGILISKVYHLHFANSLWEKTWLFDRKVESAFARAYILSDTLIFLHRNKQWVIN